MEIAFFSRQDLLNLLRCADREALRQKGVVLRSCANYLGLDAAGTAPPCAPGPKTNDC